MDFSSTVHKLWFRMKALESCFENNSRFFVPFTQPCFCMCGGSCWFKNPFWTPEGRLFLGWERLLVTTVTHLSRECPHWHLIGWIINNGIKPFNRRPEAATKTLRKWITAVFKVLRCKIPCDIGRNLPNKKEN